MPNQNQDDTGADKSKSAFHGEHGASHPVFLEDHPEKDQAIERAHERAAAGHARKFPPKASAG